MKRFENGRLQTAARAVGVMQAAYEAAYDYAPHRSIFGRTMLEHQLNRAKPARMAILIQACRQATYHVARTMAGSAARTHAAVVKAFACRAAERVTREPMQMHGGMG